MDIVSNIPQDLTANLTAVKDTHFKTHQDGNEALTLLLFILLLPPCIIVKDKLHKHASIFQIYDNMFMNSKYKIFVLIQN